MSKSSDQRAHVQWAVESKPRVPSCQSCARFPEAVKVINDVIELKRLGKSKVSINQLLSYVQKECSYGFGATALRNHINHCLGGFHGE